MEKRERGARVDVTNDGTAMRGVLSRAELARNFTRQADAIHALPAGVVADLSFADGQRALIQLGLRNRKLPAAAIDGVQEIGHVATKRAKHALQRTHARAVRRFHAHPGADRAAGHALDAADVERRVAVRLVGERDPAFRTGHRHGQRCQRRQHTRNDAAREHERCHLALPPGTGMATESEWLQAIITPALSTSIITVPGLSAVLGVAARLPDRRCMIA